MPPQPNEALENIIVLRAFSLERSVTVRRWESHGNREKSNFGLLTAATGENGASKHLLLARIERRPAHLDLARYPHLPQPFVAATRSADYATLLAGGAGHG